MIIQQISVFLENRAGQLSEITDILANDNIDLRAIHIAEATDYGVVRLIVSRPQATANLLWKKGYILSTRPVVAAPVPDQPGGLAKVLHIVADAGIDINYMYSMFGAREGMAYMVFRVKDVKHLSAVLEANGLNGAAPEELGIQE